MSPISRATILPLRRNASLASALRAKTTESLRKPLARSMGRRASADLGKDLDAFKAKFDEWSVQKMPGPLNVRLMNHLATLSGLGGDYRIASLARYPDYPFPERFVVGRLLSLARPEIRSIAEELVVQWRFA